MELENLPPSSHINQRPRNAFPTYTSAEFDVIGVVIILQTWEMQQRNSAAEVKSTLVDGSVAAVAVFRFFDLTTAQKLPKN